MSVEFGPSIHSKRLLHTLRYNFDAILVAKWVRSVCSINATAIPTITTGSSDGRHAN